MITRIWRAEPVAILTTIVIVIEAVIDALALEGWTWETLAMAAVTALAGLVARQSVYAPDTVEEGRHAR